MTVSIPRPVHQEEAPEHRVLREIFRHYPEFKELVAQGGSAMLEHSYLVPDADVPAQCPGNKRADKEHRAIEDVCIYCGGGMHKVSVSFCFWDLHRGLKDLAPRKREALYHNVIRDAKQKDVAEIMGITTVTVGQYVEHAFRNLIAQHVVTFTEEEDG